MAWELLFYVTLVFILKIEEDPICYFGRSRYITSTSLKKGSSTALEYLASAGTTLSIVALTTFSSLADLYNQPALAFHA